MAKSLSETPRKLLIGGEFRRSDSGKTLTTFDPANEEPVAEVSAAGKRDVDKAIEHARRALPNWRKLPPKKRGRLLHQLAEEILENKERLAELETRDCGKPLSQARGDVEGCARFFEFYAGFADKIHGESIPLSEDHVDFTVKEPLGVTAQIIPWNFPIKLLGRSAAPALAAGNVAIIKPAEETPLSALEVGQLALEAGFPPGVFNVIPGFGPEAGAPLAGHPDIDSVSFTGSIVTGREVAKLAMDNVTPVHLELGGKNPNIVFPDANLDAALDNALTAIFTTNAGQVCSAGSRLLVHETIHDEFVETLAARAQNLSIGPGIEDRDIGPLISDDQFEKVKQYIEIGRDEVGDPVVGGEILERAGYFVEPTIFNGVENEMRIAQEEIFGPVLSVIEFGDEEEAIRLANDTEYGLVAGIFTSDHGRAHRLAKEIQAGQIFINEWFAGGPETPFGGYKRSGFGREKGLEAIESYVQVKNICSNVSRDADAGGT